MEQVLQMALKRIALSMIESRIKWLKFLRIMGENWRPLSITCTNLEAWAALLRCSCRTCSRKWCHKLWWIFRQQLWGIHWSSDIQFLYRHSWCNLERLPSLEAFCHLYARRSQGNSARHCSGMSPFCYHCHSRPSRHRSSLNILKHLL